MTFDAEKFKAEIKEAIEKMSPQERAEFINKVCGGVDRAAKTIVRNADAIWQAHHPKG